MEEDHLESSQSDTSQAASQKKVSFPTINKPGQPANTSSGKKLFKIFIAILILAALGAGGWFLFQEPKIEKTVIPTPTPMELEEIPTVPPVQINRSDVKIQILNGSGITGEAAYLQGQLRNLGYETIDVGNADRQDYVSTEVTFSSKVSDEVRTEITSKLNDIYKEVKTSTGSISGKDIQIIVGLRKGQSPKPTATSTPKVTVTPTPKVTGTVTPTPTKTPTPTP